MHAFRTVLIGLTLVFLGTATAADPATPDAEALDRGSEIAYRRALKPAADDKRLNADAAAFTRLRRIANRLVASAVTIHPESKHHAWAVNLIPGAAPDVLVYPGGRVIVTEGLVVKGGLGDEEVGAILAHAFAHALLGHDARRMSKTVSTREESADPNRRALAVAEATAEAIRATRYTAAEVEAADRTSIEMLARAAYDPRAAGSTWRRLRTSDKGIVERSPVSEERLVALDASGLSAVPLYEETRKEAAAYARQRPPRPAGPAKGNPQTN